MALLVDSIMDVAVKVPPNFLKMHTDPKHVSI